MKRLLVPILLLTAGFAQAANQRWYERFSKGFAATADPVAIVGVAVFFLVLIGGIVIFEIVKSHARVSARTKLSWEQFKEFADEKGLRPTEASFLEHMIRKAGLPNAEAVFHSPVAFEDVIEHHYSAHSGGLHKVSREDFAQVTVLREKLGYANLPIEAPYITTRQFRIGDRIGIQFVEENKSGSSSILDVDEIGWTISNPLSTVVPIGSKVRVALTRGGDAEYQVVTRVGEFREDEIRLEHSRELTRKQLRNWVRVDVNLPVKVRILESEGGDFKVNQLVPGRVLDISGGGMSIRVPGRVPKGARLALDFELAEFSFRAVEVQVVRVSPTPTGTDEAYQHSASFLGLAKPQQERIVRFVFERQRQDSQWR